MDKNPVFKIDLIWTEIQRIAQAEWTVMIFHNHNLIKLKHVLSINPFSLLILMVSFCKAS